VNYKNAEAILPEHLLLEIQQYIQGEYIYIPTPNGTRKKWGERTGNRDFLNNRNRKIRESFQIGSTITQLATDYCLSIDSIKKIVYKK
jgi:Mor family transcriptional regulator